MRVLFTPTFDRTIKKLHPKQKHDLDTAVRDVLLQPALGSAKVGDLAGVKVYKFRMLNMTCLLAYRILDEHTLKLLMVGPHENFYRELKRAES